MNGILNVLKPPGMTSFDVVAYLRRVLKTKKIGHTGTLDPEAAGVLPVCIGSATKAIEYITAKNKTYRGELTLGTATDTQDSYGQVIAVKDVELSESQIRETFKSFIGKYNQIPPMYSAVKIEGKKLYELARSGVTVEREPREVEIGSVGIVRIDGMKVLFDVECSKGTYIRTLCADIGDRLGCGGHMSFLLRTKSGIFDLRSAYTLEDIARLAGEGEINRILIKVDEVFEDYDKVILSKDEEKRFLNGVHVKPDNSRLSIGAVVRVYNEGNGFLALAGVVSRPDGLKLKSIKTFLI